MSKQRQRILPSYFKTLSVGPVSTLNPRPSTGQTGNRQPKPTLPPYLSTSCTDRFFLCIRLVGTVGRGELINAAMVVWLNVFSSWITVLFTLYDTNRLKWDLRWRRWTSNLCCTEIKCNKCSQKETFWPSPRIRLWLECGAVLRRRNIFVWCWNMSREEIAHRFWKTADRFPWISPGKRLFSNSLKG